MKIIPIPKHYRFKDGFFNMTLDTLMEISKFIRYNFRTMVMDYESIARGEVPKHLQIFKDYKESELQKIIDLFYSLADLVEGIKTFDCNNFKY